MTKAYLVLEDGTCYEGKSFGCTEETYGELIFNTSMAGYQEILTDPASRGQIVVMTYPLIGNYGFSADYNESSKAQASGFIVKELCNTPSNWKNEGTPNEFFIENNITGICDIDTRHLTQHIRDFGSMYAIITTKKGDIKILAEKAKKYKNMKHDYVMEASIDRSVHINGAGPKLALLDLGIEQSVLDMLSRKSIDIHRIPANSTVDEIMAIEPEGIIISNGPGSPENISYVIDTVKKLIGKKPVLGMGLGYLVLGMALGGNIKRLKYGYHGSGIPVMDLSKNRIYITSQNTGYVLVDELPHKLNITHINFNDKTIAGFMDQDIQVMGIQFKPTDYGFKESRNVIDIFLEMVISNA